MHFVSLINGCNTFESIYIVSLCIEPALRSCSMNIYWSGSSWTIAPIWFIWLTWPSEHEQVNITSLIRIRSQFVSWFHVTFSLTRVPGTGLAYQRWKAPSPAVHRKSPVPHRCHLYATHGHLLLRFRLGLPRDPHKQVAPPEPHVWVLHHLRNHD